MFPSSLFPTKYIVTVEPIPAPIQLGVNSWVDANDLSNGNVVSWPDKGSNNIPFLQGITAPVRDSNSVNGLPGVVFNGLTQGLSAQSAWSLSQVGSNAHTLIFVARVSSPGFSNGLFDWVPNGATGNSGAYMPYADGNIYYDDPDTASGRVSVASGLSSIAPHIITFQRNGSNRIIRIDGTELLNTSSTNNAFPNTSYPFILGQYANATPVISLGDFYYFNYSLSPSQLSQMAAYLNAKWNGLVL